MIYYILKCLFVFYFYLLMISFKFCVLPGKKIQCWTVDSSVFNQKYNIRMLF